MEMLQHQNQQQAHITLCCQGLKVSALWKHKKKHAKRNRVTQRSRQIFMGYGKLLEKWCDMFKLKGLTCGCQHVATQFLNSVSATIGAAAIGLGIEASDRIASIALIEFVGVCESIVCRLLQVYVARINNTF